MISLPLPYSNCPESPTPRCYNFSFSSLIKDYSSLNGVGVGSYILSDVTLVYLVLGGHISIDDSLHDDYSQQKIGNLEQDHNVE